MSKRTFQPNNRRRAKVHGFRLRMRTRAGRAILARSSPQGAHRALRVAPRRSVAGARQGEPGGPRRRLSQRRASRSPTSVAHCAVYYRARARRRATRLRFGFIVVARPSAMRSSATGCGAGSGRSSRELVDAGARGNGCRGPGTPRQPPSGAGLACADDMHGALDAKLRHDDEARAGVRSCSSPRNVCVLILRVYRAVISPLYGDVCRYYPSLLGLRAAARSSSTA